MFYVLLCVSCKFFGQPNNIYFTMNARFDSIFIHKIHLKKKPSYCLTIYLWTPSAHVKMKVGTAPEGYGLYHVITPKNEGFRWVPMVYMEHHGELHRRCCFFFRGTLEELDLDRRTLLPIPWPWLQALVSGVCPLDIHAHKSINMHCFGRMSSEHSKMGSVYTSKTNMDTGYPK